VQTIEQRILDLFALKFSEPVLDHVQNLAFVLSFDTFKYHEVLTIGCDIIAIQYSSGAVHMYSLTVSFKKVPGSTLTATLRFNVGSIAR
jgi:hypothetical protein